MTEKKADYAIQQQLDSILAASKPVHTGESLGLHVIVNGGNVFINTGDQANHQTNHAALGDSPITSQQDVWLCEMVDKISVQEKLLDPNFLCSSIWQALCASLGITSYKQIKQADFNQAKAFLITWLAHFS